MTDTTSRTPAVTTRRTYRATPDAAFDAWTDPASLERWFGPPDYRARVLCHELRLGGTWRFRMESEDGACFHHYGTFVEISPPRRLAFTWASEELIEGWRDDSGDPTLVTVEFEPCADGVTVTITHRGLAAETARRALTGGWSGALTCLQGFLERTEVTR